MARVEQPGLERHVPNAFITRVGSSPRRARPRLRAVPAARSGGRYAAHTVSGCGSGRFALRALAHSLRSEHPNTRACPCDFWITSHSPMPRS